MGQGVGNPSVIVHHNLRDTRRLSSPSSTKDKEAGQVCSEATSRAMEAHICASNDIPRPPFVIVEFIYMTIFAAEKNPAVSVTCRDAEHPHLDTIARVSG